MSARTLWQLGGTLGFVLVLALGWFLLVSPLYASVGTSDRLRADIDRQNAALQTALEIISEVDASALEQNVAELRRKIPEAVSEPEMIRQLQTAAMVAGATFTGVNFQPAALFAAVPDTAGSAPLPIDPADLDAVTKEGLLLVQFSATVTGDLTQLARFADAIQVANRLFLVQSIGFDAPDDEGMVEATVTALTFVLPATPAPPPGED